MEAPLFGLELRGARTGSGAKNARERFAFEEQLLVNQLPRLKPENVSLHMLPAIDVDLVGAFKHGSIADNGKWPIQGPAVATSKKRETLSVGLARVDQDDSVARDGDGQGSRDRPQGPRTVVKRLPTNPQKLIVADYVVNIDRRVPRQRRSAPGERPKRLLCEAPREPL